MKPDKSSYKKLKDLTVSRCWHSRVKCSWYGKSSKTVNKNKYLNMDVYYIKQIA